LGENMSLTTPTKMKLGHNKAKYKLS